MITLKSQSTKILVDENKAVELQSVISRAPGPNSISHWKLNDAADDNIIIDSSGDNTGTSQNDTSYMTTTGKPFNALKFNGLLSNPQNQWAMNDDSGDTVVDDNAGSYNLASSVNTSIMTADGHINKSFYFNGVLSGTTYLEGHYKLNNTSGTTITDSSGNGKNGSISENLGIMTTVGKIGNAIEFHGDAGRDLVAHYKMNDNGDQIVEDSKNNYDASASENTSGLSTTGRINEGLDMYLESSKTIQFPNGVFQSTSDFAVGGWFYHRDYTYPKTTFNMRSNGSSYQEGNPGWQIGHSFRSSGLDIVVNDGVNLIRGVIDCDTGYLPSDWLNSWTHMMVLFDRTGGLVKLYINGVLQTDTINISSVTGSLGISDPVIGNTAGWLLDAIVDDFRFYDELPNANDIIGIYNDGMGTETENENITIPQLLTTADDEVSIAFWASMKSDNDNNCVSVGFNYANDHGWLVRGAYSGTIRYYVGNTQYDTGISLDDGMHHHCLTHTGSTTKYYLDGELIDERTTKNMVADDAGETRIGAEFVHYLDGIIDDVRIYNKDISDGEVRAIYADGNGTEDTTNVSGGFLDYESISHSFWYNANINPSGARLGRLGSSYINCNSSGKISTTVNTNPYVGYLGIGTTSSGSLDEWNHCVITFEKSGATTLEQIYINGVLDISGTIEGTRVVGGSVQLGHSDNFNYWRGNLDDLRVYSRVLSTYEVESIYNDSSEFYESDYINCGDDSSLQITGDLSFGCWFKLFPNTKSTSRRIGLVSKHYEEYEIFLDQSGGQAAEVMKFYKSNGSNGYEEASLDYSFQEGVWYNVYITFNSTTKKAIWYINGQNMKEHIFSSSSLIDNTNHEFVIGKRSTNEAYYFYGKIDDVRLYTRVMSYDEISSIYNSGAGTESVAYDTNRIGLESQPVIELNTYKSTQIPLEA